MTDRENNVYKAKLAEQAERYDGKWPQEKIDFSLGSWLSFEATEKSQKNAIAQHQTAKRGSKSGQGVPDGGFQVQKGEHLR